MKVRTPDRCAGYGRGRRRGVTIVGTMLLGLAAATTVGCSNVGSDGASAPSTAPAVSSGGGFAAASSTTLPPPGSFATTVVVEGLVEPVPVPGEPTRSAIMRADDPRANALPGIYTGSPRLFPMSVTLPEDWTTRNLVVCGWTEVDGFIDCHATPGLRPSGRFDVGIPVRDEHQVVEVWLLDNSASRAVRRLGVWHKDEVDWPLNLVLGPGFERVNDVLGQQPAPDGNYLVVAPA